MANNYEFLTGDRGASILLYDSFLYKKHGSYKSSSYWNCIRNCPVTVTIKNQLIVSCRDKKFHTRSDDIVETKKLIFKSKLRNKLLENPHTKAFDIYTAEIVKVEACYRVFMPQFHTMRSVLYQYRSISLPKVSKKLEDLTISGTWEKTIDNDQFLLWNEGTIDRILIFSTYKNICLLCSSITALMDGTFYVVPKIFKQLYTIHGTVNGKIFPMAYCLLPNKTCNIYVRMLNGIKQIAQNIGQIFYPAQFQIDFEAATIKTIKMIFPLSTIKGCYFHFSQSIWRKTQNLGISKLYKDDKNVQQWIKLILTLPLTPLYFLNDAWLLISSTASNTPAIHKMMEYVMNTYMDEGKAGFPRLMWNHFYTDTHRTTNALESWHGKLKMLIQKPHPNIWTLIHALKQDQAYMSVKMELAKNNILDSAKNKYYIDKEISISLLKDLLTSRTINLEDFINQMCSFAPKKCS